MFDFSLLIPDGIVWLLLSLSVASLFVSRTYWPYLLACSLTSALWLERLSFPAAIVTAAGLGLAAISRKVTGRKSALLHVITLVWIAALSLHLVPGFDNLMVLDKVMTGPGSLPFTLYLNLDKPLIIFALFLLLPELLGKHRPVSAKQVSVLAAALLLLPVMALGLGLVRPEFSLPEWLWLFALNNLLFTCVAEEALFRGYVQHLLSRYFNHWIAIGVASALFGLAHFSGGPIFILVAGCAGALYGLTYYWTGRLSMAIAIHFAFNLIHLIFFTYPLPTS